MRRGPGMPSSWMARASSARISAAVKTGSTGSAAGGHEEAGDAEGAESAAARPGLARGHGLAPLPVAVGRLSDQQDLREGVIAVVGE
jgi:hypothetical protein